MSKKKERKLKRLRRLSIWSLILEMIVVEFIISGLAVFSSALAVCGIANTIVLNTAKDCNIVVNAINQNWKTESREQIDARLQAFQEAFVEMDGIYVGQKSDILAVFPELKNDFDEDAERQLEREGMVHFLDPDYNKTNFFTVSVGSDSQGPDASPRAPENISEAEKLGHSTGNNISTFLYRPQNIFRNLDLFHTLRDSKYVEWASLESVGLHLISVYESDIKDIKVCFKNTLRINAYQFNIFCTVILFMLVVWFFSGVYEIYKVVKLIQQRKRVNKLVTIDPVTGGYNRDYFIQKAGKEIKRGRKNYAVIQLRLEKYRNYCTAYGLKQGENLLEELNSELIEMLLKKEFVAHLEKSDFALLLTYQNSETLNIRLKNIMNILCERRGSQHLTFSAGVCPISSRNEDLSLVLNSAGLALPGSLKHQDEIIWFNDSMKEEQVWERRIEDDMDKALEAHEFQVYLQPKYSTKKEELSAAEALVRWIHPVLGFVSPGKFIPIFEKNGFILQLDDYMLTEVSKLQAAWLEQGKKLVPISVNVSRAHFAKENLAEHICSIVDEFKVPHEFIELELTESAFFDDKSVLLTTVRKLKEFGFKVSMDDFGAGYSSLNSLKELPLDIIKLDAEFFRSVDDISRSNLIVGETITLAKKLGMQIVAEGIETREQVDFLAEQNCDLIQGFYFSKPLPVAEFEEQAYPTSTEVE